MIIPDTSGPHGSAAVKVVGNTTTPQAALILLHGRGASAESILHITEEISVPDSYVVVAPEAAEYTWYPERFIVPSEQNQSHLDSALERVGEVVQQLHEQFGISPAQITLAGFSQGACLVAEYIKRNPARYNGVAVLSGGLIGTDEEVDNSFVGDFKQTPIYLGCDDNDFHIPAERVQQTADLFKAHQANVALHLYQGLGHTVHPEGLQFIASCVKAGEVYS